MKTYIGILALTALFATGCTAPQGATSRAYSDDVYYSSADAAADQAKLKRDLEKEKQDAIAAKRAEQDKAAPAESPATTDDYYQTTEKRTDQDGNTYVTNNYYEDKPFDYDDYYDYEYSARLRRFHNNVGYYGYYDNYYTNTYYYTYDPFYYGTSVYMGYNFWGPSYAVYSYNPGFLWYSSYGWCNDPWYNPYGYNPYMNGYANGYNNGYMDGYNNGYYGHGGYQNNYFNSYDNNSYYYGPRGTMTANSRSNAQPSMAHRYMETVEAQTHKPFEETHGRTNNEYMKPTTVSDYMSKPARDNNTSKPMESRPVNSRPTNADNKPVYNERPANNTNERPANNTTEQKPVYNNKPGEKPAQKPAERPVYNEQQKPQERPVYEQKPAEKPVYQEKPAERPREKPQYQQQAPAQTPAPRNNTSTDGSSTKGSSTPAPTPSPAPRRR
ncbi:MAG: hypothetical protein JWO09_3042 [Bacteroidetes bacterium]|nr:hypothetical protein [Bacteroidota bacterium]